MSLSDELLTILSSYHGGYRVMRRYMHGGVPLSEKRSVKRVSDRVLRVTLTRLKKRGLVRNSSGAWFITKRGKECFTKRFPWLRRYGPEQGAKRNMIIAFDVPEHKRREREWLRRVLGDVGFHMLQKSVWFGPAPLPKEFIVSLKNFGMLEYIKFFKAEEWDVV